MKSEAEQESKNMDSMLILLFLIQSAQVNRVLRNPVLVSGPGHVARDCVHTWRGDVASHSSPHDRLGDQWQEGDKAASPH